MQTYKYLIWQQVHFCTGHIIYRWRKDTQTATVLIHFIHNCLWGDLPHRWFKRYSVIKQNKSMLTTGNSFNQPQVPALFLLHCVSLCGTIWKAAVAVYAEVSRTHCMPVRCALHSSQTKNAHTPPGPTWWLPIHSFCWTLKLTREEGALHLGNSWVLVIDNKCSVVWVESSFIFWWNSDGDCKIPNETNDKMEEKVIFKKKKFNEDALIIKKEDTI